MKIHFLMIVASLLSISCHARCINSQHVRPQGGSKKYVCAVKNSETSSFTKSANEVRGRYPLLCNGCKCAIEAHTNE